MQLLSGRVDPDLAQKIARLLKIKLTAIHFDDSGSGEIYCKINESLRGNDVFVLQTHGGVSVNQAIMEQLIIIDAAKRASAQSITAICPSLGYARQDRKSGGREPITASLVMNMFAAAGADRIMTIDLHSGQTQGFFNGPFDHLIAMPIIYDYIVQNFDTNDLVIVSPDGGRVKLNERYSVKLGCGMALIHKHRPTNKKNSVEARYLIGDVKDKTCIIIDDMIDTGGTLCAAANLLEEKGAKKIYGMATHGILSGSAKDYLKTSAFSKFVVTDSLPQSHVIGDKIEVLSVAPLLANAIEAVFTCGSLSALFDDDNQIQR